MIELHIDSIRVSLRHYQRVIVLKEMNTQKFLPIWIGADIADAIALSLQDIDLPRPLTHDLMNELVSHLGGQVESIIVNKLENDTYYASIKINTNNGIIDIDARPSDAIALSVRPKAPIYVDDLVFEKACINIDNEKNIIQSDQNFSEVNSEITDEELQKLSAFKDFVSELDFDLSDEKDDKMSEQDN